MEEEDSKGGGGAGGEGQEQERGAFPMQVEGDVKEGTKETSKAMEVEGGEGQQQQAEGDGEGRRYEAGGEGKLASPAKARKIPNWKKAIAAKEAANLKKVAHAGAAPTPPPPSSSEPSGGGTRAAPEAAEAADHEVGTGIAASTEPPPPAAAAAAPSLSAHTGVEAMSLSLFGGGDSAPPKAAPSLSASATFAAVVSKDSATAASPLAAGAPSSHQSAPATTVGRARGRPRRSKAKGVKTMDWEGSDDGEEEEVEERAIPVGRLVPHLSLRTVGDWAWVKDV